MCCGLVRCGMHVTSGVCHAKTCECGKVSVFYCLMTYCYCLLPSYITMGIRTGVRTALDLASLYK